MELQAGSDFRRKEFRREVFLRFYEFHLRYKAHPGGVYYFIPFLAKTFQWNLEQRLWFATLNAFTQYPMTSLIIFRRFPDLKKISMKDFKLWFLLNRAQLPFDIDRNKQKYDISKAIEQLQKVISDYGSLKNFYTGTFKELWERMTSIHSLGRLGAWSGLEFIKIASQRELKFEYNSLMLEDITGSKSHRNGLCLVLGRDNLEWKKNFYHSYTSEVINELITEGEKLLHEARQRLPNFEIGYETLESTLCCYKSWHRPNRRYPNVYNDMACLRIQEISKRNPQENFNVFWEAREDTLPKELRLECNPNDPGLASVKQNLYLNTGQIVMMDLDWVCFENDQSWKRRRLV